MSLTHNFLYIPSIVLTDQILQLFLNCHRPLLEMCFNMLQEVCTIANQLTFYGVNYWTTLLVEAESSTKLKIKKRSIMINYQTNK